MISILCDPDQDGVLGVDERPSTPPFADCVQQDNCPTSPNPFRWDSDCNDKGDACDPTTFDPDPDGDGVSVGDNCPCVYNPVQADMDGDGIGDKCDDDMDNDGYSNADDCHDQNAMVGPDMDGDGYCDSYNVSCGNDINPIPCEDLCDQACGQVVVWHGTGAYNHCIDRCKNLDNCIDLSSPFCYPWIYCAMVGVGCTPDLRLCEAAYSNPDQSDIDNDQLGDKCEDVPTASELHLWEDTGPASKFGGGGTPQGLMYLAGEAYYVSFRARGGSVTEWNGNPVFNQEPRDGVRIGVCHCDDKTPQGEWVPECGYPDACNKQGERNTATGYLAWNPINANECDDYQLHANAPYQTETLQKSLCHEREFTFTKDDSQNEHLFLWPWKWSVRYEDFGQIIGEDFDSRKHSGRTTTARAAWPTGSSASGSGWCAAWTRSWMRTRSRATSSPCTDTT